MKRYIVLLFALLPVLSFGQEDQDQLTFHSISLSSNFYAGNSTTGFMGNIDLAFRKKEHIFKINAMSAAEIDICVWGPCYTDSYYSFDLMYGREFFKKQLLAVDLFAGVGYLNFQTSNPDPNNRGYLTKSTIGFPLQARFRFRDGKVFNLGLQIHGNINSAKSIIAFGPFFQWNFHISKSQ